MSFNQYKNIGELLQEFPLTYQEENFIEELDVKIDPYFQNRLKFLLQEGIVFNSEYAICENIIYPILVEIWQNYADKLLIWSHQPLNYDENLSGIPDYIIAQRSPRGKVIFDKPYLILMEAKKDKFDEGWGECLAELIAVQKLNNDIEKPLFGIVTNGKLWEFGILQKSTFTKNIKYYILENLSSLMSAINFVFAQSVAII